MANLTTPTPSEYSNTHLDPVAGFLSYLIPGLGQIKRGKVGKGILFFVCIHCLFFWGLSLGHWKNVYLPRADDPNRYRKMEIALGISFPRTLWNRIPFVGQFWVGIAAWPALIQWYSYPDETSIDYQPQEGDNGLPILWLIPGHARIINGYNAQTKSVLYTDSWGAGFEVQSMPYAEAQRITEFAFVFLPPGVIK